MAHLYIGMLMRRGREDRFVDPDPCSPHAISRLQEWIKTCDGTHKRCHREDIPQLPSRVIDVESLSSFQDVKLVETSDGQRAPYISLSHCWGQSTPFITTRDNLDERKRGISIGQAPATFQHAIAVSRSLGIRYLWIDSLCIIQGDSEDWQIESSRMGIIYRDSTLTLAASNASSDTEGFLNQRPHTCSTLKFISPEGHTAEAHLRTSQQHELLNHRGAKTKTQPLDKRAWCLQEAYLPKRIVKFLDSKILWRCQDNEWDEAMNKTGHATGNPFTLQNIFKDAVPFGHRVLTRLTPYSGWYRMVTEYSKRSLTYISDKLPAVAGLAALVAEHDGGKYCAGVWWEDVAWGLCWKKSSGLERIEEYIAPSWSWASVNGPVEFIDAHDTMYAQSDVTLMSRVTFYNFYFAKRGLSEYGQIDMAWIYVEAPMTLVDAADEERFRISGADSSEETELTFDFQMESRESMEGLMALFLMRRDDRSIRSGKQSGKVLLFGLIVRAAPHLAQRCKTFGLENDAPIYERVGFFEILTSEAREREFWGQKHATPIVIV